jgi:ElaB/YqjD/DUF883 family membrane-anchored ribosome-binding protein
MTDETDRIEAQINRSRHALNNTIEQLGGKLSPGQILDEVLGLAQGQAGQFTANLGRQVRDNPLPVLLVGAGIAMLFLHKKNGHAAQASSARWSDEDWGYESRYRDLEAVRASIVRRTDETDDEYDMRVYDAEARVLGVDKGLSELPDAFKQRVKSAGEKLSHTAKGIRERMGAAMHAVGSGVGHAADAVTSGVGSAAHAVSSGASKATHFVGDQAANLKEGLSNARYKTQDLYNEYPLAAGAIGLGIGALVGAMTPLTNTEREQLQGVADAAAKAGADLAEKGARAVERTAEKATAAFH